MRVWNLIGRTGRVRLIVEEYNGKRRNKISAWLVPEKVQPAQQRPPTQQTQRPQPPPRPMRPVEEEGDDIPF